MAGGVHPPAHVSKEPQATANDQPAQTVKGVSSSMPVTLTARVVAR
jgi:hypothetical protein